MTTWYVVVTGLVVAGLTLLGRWVVRLLAAPEYFEAHEALPWVALGWAMYGLYLVFVTIGGRAGVTSRNFPAALAGRRRQRRRARRARRPARHRGGGHRAVRGLPRDARRPAPADAQAVHRAVRMGPPGARRRAARGRSRWRASCCCRRTASKGSSCARSRSPRSRSRFLATGFMRADERAGLLGLAGRARARAERTPRRLIAARPTRRARRRPAPRRSPPRRCSSPAAAPRQAMPRGSSFRSLCSARRTAGACCPRRSGCTSSRSASVRCRSCSASRGRGRSRTPRSRRCPRSCRARRSTGRRRAGTGWWCWLAPPRSPAPVGPERPRQTARGRRWPAPRSGRPFHGLRYEWA